MRHYDGNTWARTRLPTDEFPTDIHGSGDDNIYVTAIGRVYHFDGDGWDEQLIGGSWRTVWVVGPGVAFIGVSTGSDLGAAWLVDGVWTRFPELEGIAIRDIWASSASFAIAVSDFGRIFHFDGTTWTEQPAITGFSLRSIEAVSANEVYVTGARGTLLHRDGLRWWRIRARNPNTGLGKITRMGSTLVVAAGDGIEGLLGVVSL